MVAIRIFRSIFLQSYLILGDVWLQKKIISIGFSCLYIFLLFIYYLYGDVAVGKKKGIIEKVIGDGSFCP